MKLAFSGSLPETSFSFSCIWDTIKVTASWFICVQYKLVWYGGLLTSPISSYGTLSLFSLSTLSLPLKAVLYLDLCTTGQGLGLAVGLIGSTGLLWSQKAVVIP